MKLRLSVNASCLVNTFVRSGVVAPSRGRPNIRVNHQRNLQENLKTRKRHAYLEYFFQYSPLGLGNWVRGFFKYFAQQEVSLSHRRGQCFFSKTDQCHGHARQMFRRDTTPGCCKHRLGLCSDTSRFVISRQTSCQIPYLIPSQDCQQCLPAYLV